MSKPALPELADDTLLPPDRYSLVERLGEGGMGTVWRARQRAPIVRDVAVKLIKAGLDTDAVIRQFNAERRALELMDHAAIAKVFDAGRTTLGRPYFVMEYVRGEPLNRFCDGQRLSIRDRLNLFGEVCDAVQHAHTKGVLHRDLKPGNVLVGVENDRPVPKVIDFGLAKALGPTQLTDQTIATWLQRTAGTPQYMSPEQASASPLGLDTRSDVYSLGVMLYELIVGFLPIEIELSPDTTNETVLRQIAAQDVIAPAVRWAALSPSAKQQIADQRRETAAAIERVLQSDLQWVILKALRRDRTERYGSAADLKRDLQNWLSGRAVMAGPDSTTYRVRKFVQRNRPAVAAAVLLLVSLVAGLAGTTWQAVRATRAEHRAEAQRRLAERRAVTTEAVSGFLQDMISSAAPSRHGGNVPSIIEVVVNAAGRFDESDRFKDEPEVRAELQAVLGLTLLGLGRAGLAESMLRQAIEFHDANPDINPRRHRELLANLGDALRGQIRMADAVPVLERYAEMLRTAADVTELDRYVGLARLGTIYASNGDLPRGQAALEEALNGLERIGAALNTRVTTASNLGKLLSLTGEHARAEQIHRRYIDEEEQASSQISTQRAALADTLFRQHRFDDAIEEYRKALHRSEELLGPYHGLSRNIRRNLGATLNRAGRTNEGTAVETEFLAAWKLAYERGDVTTPEPPPAPPFNDDPAEDRPATNPAPPTTAESAGHG